MGPAEARPSEIGSRPRLQPGSEGRASARPTLRYRLGPSFEMNGTCGSTSLRDRIACSLATPLSKTSKFATSGRRLWKYRIGARAPDSQFGRARAESCQTKTEAPHK